MQVIPTYPTASSSYVRSRYWRIRERRCQWQWVGGNSNAYSLLSFSLCGGGVEDAAAKWVAVAVNSEAQAH